MSIYKKWLDQVEQDFTQEEYDEFWKTYLLNEQKNYERIILEKNDSIKGTVSELAKIFEMDTVTFSGFLDGINTSFETEIDLESINDDTVIDSVIVWEKLFYNMLNANADWLYEIKAWDNILTLEKRKDIKKEFNKTRIVTNENKVGRNEPCPCGSGKKYKKCCLNK